MLDRRSALELAGAVAVCHIATVRHDGSPHVVVATFAMDEGRVLTMVDHKPKRSRALQRLENIAHDPRVSVLVDHYDIDWSRLWWVRIDGRADISDSGPDWERARTVLAEKYPDYRGSPPTGPLISITTDEVTWWEAAP